jgi:tRNA pseudouridine38-40 synthase
LARRIRITLAYDGTEFHGWQVQPGFETIQGLLETIVSDMERKPVHVAGSGRTDAGVHAHAQVAAFTLENPIPPPNLQKAINRLLPPSIRILRVEEVHEKFHPRFDSIAKTYRYTIQRAQICAPFDYRYAYHHPYPLDEALMIAAAPVFEGEHDFTKFCAKDDRPGSKVRTIFHSRMEREGDRLVYTVRGTGFLKHMVRNLVGTLIEVGRGNLDGRTIPYRSGPTAPARGLALQSVEYEGWRSA